MKLQILTGASGAGKTQLLYQQIIHSAMARTRTRHIVLVPEQFSLETEKLLLEMHPRHAILNIEVLSFERLGHWIFAERGKNNRAILDETGKSMLLRRAVGLRKKELNVFAGQLSRPGFINRMKAMICELYQYGITEEKLGHLEEEIANYPLLVSKLKDLEIFYQAFRGEKGENRIAEELPYLLLEELPYSSYLKGAMVAIDGFSGFTPVQYQIIGEMMVQAEQVGITLTLPSMEEDSYRMEEYDLFSLTQETQRRLIKVAEEKKVPVEYFYQEKTEEIPTRKADLEHLEKYFLRGKGRKVYSGEQEGVHLLHERTPGREVEKVAAQIYRLVHGEKIRYREIAVVVGDLEGYRPLLEKTFRQYQIPYFMDQKKGILHHPYVTFLRSAMEVLEKGFTDQTIFVYLKSGFAGLSREEVDELENYVMATGQRGLNRWKTPWVVEKIGREEVDLAKINDLRLRAVTPLLHLRQGVYRSSGTFSDAIDALRELCRETQSKDRLLAWSEEFAQEGDLQKAEEYARISDFVEGIFDQATELLGQEKLSLKEMGDVLDAGFAEAHMGTAPSCLDQIQVGDLERSRLGRVRALFFLGVNEGIVPTPEKTGGILSDKEREILKKHCIELAPTGKEERYREQFFLYRVLAKPTQYLMISCAKMSESGASLSPSLYWNQIRGLFPGIPVEGDADISSAQNWHEVWEEVSSRVKQLKEEGITDWWKQLYLLMGEDEAKKETFDHLLLAAFFHGEKDPIQQEVARALYGDVLSGSVTRLEQYASCAYAQFLKGGLSLDERPLYEFQQKDRGNFFHRALETIFREMKKEELCLEEITPEKQKELVEHGILAALEATGSTILQETARNRYYVERWRRVMSQTVRTLCDQLKESGFSPQELEMHFERYLPLLGSEQGEKIGVLHLRGVIDRLDRMEGDQEIFVRVLDYKTGKRIFDLNEIYCGLQLQLLVYLDTALEQDRKKFPQKKILPAGVYYYCIHEPITDADKAKTVAEWEKQIQKELSLQGFTNENSQVTDNSKMVRGKEITEEQMNQLCNHVREKLVTWGEEILSGNILASPYRKKEKTACDYCQYFAVCGFDPRLPGFSYRDIREKTDEEIWKALQEEEKIRENASDMDRRTEGGH